MNIMTQDDWDPGVLVSVPNRQGDTIEPARCLCGASAFITSEETGVVSCNNCGIRGQLHQRSIALVFSGGW